MMKTGEDIIQEVMRRRDDAGLKLVIKHEFLPGKTFTAYAKNPEQLARWREDARKKGLLLD